jgi:hypothetical protein
MHSSLNVGVISIARIDRATLAAAARAAAPAA